MNDLLLGIVKIMLEAAIADLLSFATARLYRVVIRMPHDAIVRQQGNEIYEYFYGENRIANPGLKG